MSITQKGTESLEVARDGNTLAPLYQNQGKYEEAEPLYKRALELYEQHYGSQHPATALGLNNLAGLY